MKSNKALGTTYILLAVVFGILALSNFRGDSVTVGILYVCAAVAFLFAGIGAGKKAGQKKSGEDRKNG